MRASVCVFSAAHHKSGNICETLDYMFCSFQALQAPACHENMVKVGGYILGEFGNLIAGDPRSRYFGL